MALTSLGVLLLLSPLLYGQTEGKPEAVLKLEPDRSLIFTGESVTLSCEIKEGHVSDWKYTWRQNYGDIIIDSGESSHIISSAEWHDEGVYTCFGRRSTDSLESEWSTPMRLTVQALPTATVKRVSPQGTVYPGDTVTLQCDIPDHEDWSYKWYKNKHPLTNENQKTITLNADAAGSYFCEGSRRDRPTKSQLSDNHSVTVTAIMTIEQNPVYTGETVTLRCSAGPSSDWKYIWFRSSTKTTTGTEVAKSSRHTINGDTLTISEATHSDWGYYSCYGHLSPTTVITAHSAASYLTVKDSKPRANLMSNKTAVFTGDTVTLTCSVGESSGWRFYWYRHSTGSDPVSEGIAGLYTLTPSSVSEGGEFWCRGGRGNPVYYTDNSQPISINVTARPYAVLSLQPNWTQIYIGETVTIKCEIKGTDDFKGWEYSWYNGTNPVVTIESEYKFNPTNIERVEFTCKGDRDSVHSETSKPLRLNVSGKPQPILSVSPSWLNPGDSVTLTCEVEVSSTDWRFYWYRAVPYQVEFPSLAEESYSMKPLLDSDPGTRESSYILHGDTHTAGYVCRAGRGRPVYHSYYSKPQFLWSGDQHPSASLTLNTNRSQHFISESVSLSCEGTSTGWKVKRNTTDAVSDCSSNWGSMTGHICTLSNSNSEYTGVHWCESGSGEYSNAVNITLTYGNVILESPVHPVTEGDSVTLRCKQRNPSPNSKADFYKDGGLIQNGTSGEMTIPAVSKSHEGLYRCRYSDGEESPQSWLVVRASLRMGYTSFLQRRLLCGVLVASPFLLATILLLMIHHQRSAKCPVEEQPDYDDVVEYRETSPPAEAGPRSAPLTFGM